jgi:hypothetical protein
MRANDRCNWLAGSVAMAALVVLAGCGLRSGMERRPPRVEDVTLHFLSQSGFQGEIIPCG